MLIIHYCIYGWPLPTAREKALGYVALGGALHALKFQSAYTQSPLQDSRLFGPRPWKILATTYELMGS